MVSFAYITLRNRLKSMRIECTYLDGRVPADQQNNPMAPGFMGMLMLQLREAVRGSADCRSATPAWRTKISSYPLQHDRRQVIGLLRSTG